MFNPNPVSHLHCVMLVAMGYSVKKYNKNILFVLYFFIVYLCVLF